GEHRRKPPDIGRPLPAELIRLLQACHEPREFRPFPANRGQSQGGPIQGARDAMQGLLDAMIGTPPGRSATGSAEYCRPETPCNALAQPGSFQVVCAAPRPRASRAPLAA